MLELTRTVRFSINPGPPEGDSSQGINGFSAAPCMRGLGRHYEIDVTCRGAVDARTGYLINIKTIDQAVRSLLVPIIDRACRERPETDPALLVRELLLETARALPVEVRGLRWRLSPYYSLEMTAEHTDRVLLRQQFDFSASHRLDVPSMSPEANREYFGKCNNPNGHGHNYRVEPAVAIRPGGRFGLPQLEALTHAALIERFDHRHLNLDTAEFDPEKGANPSVENIARVFFGLLAPAISAASAGDAELRSITVWETDRTSSTYPA